ncbi:MAG: heme ABC transporter ATP-binding protein CcmA [Gammaproteobacteria bacterium]|nr:MAG: heme ABC transporter ATP-binding protein CcmA [Gammaproteobacteria bacterium]
MLAVSDLSLERGGRLLFSDLSFSVGEGEMVQIIGANGSGKTSLLRVLAGLSRWALRGEVRFCGEPLAKSAEFARQRLYLGHLSAVKGVLSPRENLRYHLSGQFYPSLTAIDEALDAVGLYGCEDVPCHHLSAGQQRRVNLARLYLSDCKLWLLDEPFTAIDAAGIAALEQRMADHVRSGGAVLLTSHQTLAENARSIDLQGGKQ